MHHNCGDGKQHLVRGVFRHSAQSLKLWNACLTYCYNDISACHFKLSRFTFVAWDKRKLCFLDQVVGFTDFSVELRLTVSFP